MHEYRLQQIIAIVDGDTADVRISLGFGLSAAFRFRVAAIDAPEVSGRYAEPAGVEARNFTRAWLIGRDRTRILVRTEKGSDAAVGIGDGAFGRWLAHFVDMDTGESLSDALRAAGYERVRGVLMVAASAGHK